MTLSALWQPRPFSVLSWFLIAGSILALSACNSPPKADAEATPRPGQAGAANQEPAAVNGAIAREGAVQTNREYTGTTQPIRLVSLRSQIEGQLLGLNVDVGDSVTQGQVLAQVDAAVLTTNVAEAQAEVAARTSEVAQARAEVSDAQTQVNRARAELQQAQSDLNRLQYLFNQGAISEQQVEQARTQVNTAQATLRSTQEQVRTRQQAVIAAQGRVAAQRAVVAREQERQSYAALTAPVTGAVVERLTEPGNLVQPGTEVVKLGDFSQAKVVVQISELELSNLRPGQTVQVRLDALPKQPLTGRILRISPAADPVARLVPVEIAIPNPNRTIGSGLLARVAFTQGANRGRVTIPESALEANQPRNRGGGNNASGQAPARSGQTAQAKDLGTLFVIEGEGNQARVTARQVTLGQRGDGQVEVIAGLQPGERFVTRSSKPLKNGDSVRLSILSEQANTPR